MTDYFFTKLLNSLLSRILSVRWVAECTMFIVTLWTPTVDRRIVLFGAMQGRFYGDNAKHLFEYILSSKSDLKVYWVTRNYRLFVELKEQGKPVLYIYSLHYLKIFLRADKGVYTDSFRDLFLGPCMAHSKFKMLNLRHGRSVKRVRFARLAHKISVKENIERNFETLKTKFAISTSPFISILQEECLKIGEDKHVVTGYPRNDGLIIRSTQYSKLQFSEEGVIDILYSPSWRHGRKSTAFFPFPNFKLDEFDEFLEGINIRIWIRPHVGELFLPEVKEFLGKINKCKNLRVISHIDCPDINSSLHEFDAMISDYSAIYHDFLLLDRPILFIPYDFEEFQNKNGFLYDYLHFLPGPNIQNYSALRDELSQVSKNIDLYVPKRHVLRDKIHSHLDANSCQRVLSLIGEL